MSNVFFTEKGEKFLKILWIKKMLLILRGKSGSIVRFSCRLRLKGLSLHTCNRLRAVFLYIINLKPAITIYYNINVLNSLSSFCYLVFFIRFLRRFELMQFSFGRLRSNWERC